MKWQKVVFIFIIVMSCFFVFSTPTLSRSASNAEPKPSYVNDLGNVDPIKQAILQAVATNTNYIQGGELSNIQVTGIQISKDKQWAIAWVVHYDSQIGAVLPTEPGLVVVHYADNQWQVFLPSNPNWENTIASVPDDLLSTKKKDMWLAMSQGPAEAYTTQSGYLLPWRGGQTGYLSRSVGHDADYPSGTSHYAFDFYVPGTQICPSGGVLSTGTTGYNFNITAAKAGTVWGWDDSVANCDSSSVNFIVIQNADDPTIFQLYMHLAQGSIPPALKTVGAPVTRGQFIAIADNTGNSTGSHLHFQIEHQPYWPSANPYWNTSLDVTFDDVGINGGRPRVSPADPPYCYSSDVCLVYQDSYVSGNYYLGDSIPPTGGLSGVTTGQTVVTQTITLNGWGSDNQTGLDYGQVMANFSGVWQILGPQFNPNITYQWNLCNPALPVPNGPVSVATNLYDKAGNPAPLVGLTTFTKDYNCPIPPPSCLPDQNQVTVFEDAYYQGGCVMYNIGNYPTGQSLYPLGNDDAESILVGEDVIATLYSEENFTGHSQAIITDTAYMQYEWVPANTLSSLIVASRTDTPQAPTPINPVDSSVFREGDVIPFSWLNEGGATTFQIEIDLNSKIIAAIPWQSNPVHYIDSLGQGTYTWRVQGRNNAGISAWSAFSTFTIESPIIFPQTQTVPYSDTMETTEGRWASDGYWTYETNPNMAHSGNYSWWYQDTNGVYDNGQPNSGSLTSPPISIISSGYYLRFYYQYQTETSGRTWDERWVQIAVDNGPFKNLVQFADDPQITETSSWLYSQAIDLSAYTGHIVRIRFQFSTLDADANNYAGWGIDDFSINAIPPTPCNDNRQDNSPAQASLLVYDPSIAVPGEICPNGDYDYYKFLGKAGDRIAADVDAMINGSPLDSYLYLLDTDGKTVLAENDDEVYGVLRDPLLAYTLTKDGVYYLKLKAWKHPSVGGEGYFYTLRLYDDSIAPTATMDWLASNSYLPDTNITVTVDVSDVFNGIDRVEFYWHPTDWQSGNWVLLGTDRDGSDGWSMTFNTIGQQEGKNAAVYVQVYDKAGNWTGIGVWDLGIDKTPPVTSMTALTATQPSNAFLLQWNGSDNLSGIAYYQIQQQINNGSWTNLAQLDGSKTQYWIIGSPGNTYSYRMRGVDYSGNTEQYPSVAEVTTAIPAAGVLCYAPDSYDISGNDNSPAKASMIYANGASQTHNYCNPLSPDFQNDEDWVKMTMMSGKHYLIQSIANSQQTATDMSLYAQDGVTLLAESVPQAFGENTYLIWTPESDGLIYLRLRHLDGRVIGTNVADTLSVTTGYLTDFPIMNR